MKLYAYNFFDCLLLLADRFNELEINLNPYFLQVIHKNICLRICFVFQFSMIITIFPNTNKIITFNTFGKTLNNIKIVSLYLLR